MFQATQPPQSCPTYSQQVQAGRQMKKHLGQNAALALMHTVRTRMHLVWPAASTTAATSDASLSTV